MKTFAAFLKKECKEQARSGRLLILGLLFALLGIMNPAMAKLTPWMLEIMADSLAASGLSVSEVHITALDSWTQFFKNVPMALIAFVLLESSIFTREYAAGTLVLVLTRGLKRYKAVLAKSVVLFAMWTAGYWMSFGITFGYNAWYWDNGIAQHLFAAAGYWWLFGMWILSMTMLFSVCGRSNVAVLGGDAALIAGSYALSLIPGAEKYLPTALMDGTSLVYGVKAPGVFRLAALVALICAGVSLVTAVFVFNRKQL